MNRQSLYVNIILLLIATSSIMSNVLHRPEGLIQIITGLAFAWFIPGYSLIKAITPQKELDFKFMILGIPFSAAIDIFTGLFLEHTTIGFGKYNYITLMWVITASLLVISSIRYTRRISRKNTSTSTETEKVASGRVENKKLQLSLPSKKVSLGLFLVICCGIWGIYSALLAMQVRPKPFTSFFLSVESSSQNTFAVVKNEEGIPMRYRIEVSTGTKIIAMWDNIDLKYGDEFDVNLSNLPINKSAVTIVLYRSDDSEPYRKIEYFVSR